MWFREDRNHLVIERLGDLAAIPHFLSFGTSLEQWVEANVRTLHALRGLVRKKRYNFRCETFLRATYVDTKTSDRLLPNGVPQDSVLSSSLFKHFLHDLSSPSPNMTLLSYTDNLAIASQQCNFR